MTTHELFRKSLRIPHTLIYNFNSMLYVQVSEKSAGLTSPLHLAGSALLLGWLAQLESCLCLLYWSN